jgi:geranylgeranyl diphosphate synthase type I
MRVTEASPDWLYLSTTSTPPKGHPMQTTASPADTINRYRDAFEPVITRYFDTLASKTDTPGAATFTTEAHHLIRDLSLRGGKRQRIAFLHEAARLAGGTPDPLALTVSGLSIELLQTHLLIHDDLIDNAPTRRGGPSTFYAYSQLMPDRPQHAMGLTILAGDVAAYLALDVILDAPIDPHTATMLSRAQVAAGNGTFYGQMFDLERDFLDRPATEVIAQIADYKAARSSALAPLQMGLICGGADWTPHAATLSRYSYAFGVAGQMRDDYLGLFGDETITGKSSDSDVRDGKYTFATRLVIDRATPTQAKILAGVFGNPDASTADVDKVRQIAHDTGVPDLLSAQMDRYAATATAEASTWAAHWNNDAVQFFTSVPAWFIGRAS